MNQNTCGHTRVCGTNHRMMPLTHVALWCLMWGATSQNNSFLLRAGKCLMIGCTASFSCAPLFDVHIFERMRRRHGWAMTTFWLGHIALHFIPLLFVWREHVEAVHGLTAAIVHITWYWTASRGTWSLDGVYVPIDGGVCTWWCLTCLALVCEMGAVCL